MSYSSPSLPFPPPPLPYKTRELTQLQNRDVHILSEHTLIGVKIRLQMFKITQSLTQKFLVFLSLYAEL